MHVYLCVLLFSPYIVEWFTVLLGGVCVCVCAKCVSHSFSFALSICSFIMVLSFILLPSCMRASHHTDKPFQMAQVIHLHLFRQQYNIQQQS